MERESKTLLFTNDIIVYTENLKSFKKISEFSKVVEGQHININCISKCLKLTYKKKIPSVIQQKISTTYL